MGHLFCGMSAGISIGWAGSEIALNDKIRSPSSLDILRMGEKKKAMRENQQLTTFQGGHFVWKEVDQAIVSWVRNG